MTINLSKGEKINLTKTNAGLNSVKVGLGWDMVSSKEEKKGFFGFLKSSPEPISVDLDASVLLLDKDDKLINKDGIIFYGNLISECKAVRHSGDNLTGEGDGDDEVINVALKNVDNRVSKILFVVNIFKAFERGQNFGLVENAFIRVLDNSNGNELVKYKLTNEYSDSTSVIIGALIKEDGSWSFNALGEGLKIASLKNLKDMYL